MFGSTKLAERHVAEFVDDDEIRARSFSQPAAATLGLFLLQLIDQIDQVGPSHSEPSWFPMRCDIEAYGITTGSP